MKKIILYTSMVLLITIITVGGTYAYFVSTTNSNTVSTDASELEIIYSTGEEISGVLNLVSSKEEGKQTTLSIKLSEDSVDATANVFIKIYEISEEIATDALNWELYRKPSGGSETFVASGTFKDYQNGDKFYIEENYRLTTSDTDYTVYIWLDGNKVNNIDTPNVVGAVLNGYIGADAQHVTELK